MSFVLVIRVLLSHSETNLIIVTLLVDLFASISASIINVSITMINYIVSDCCIVLLFTALCPRVCQIKVIKVLNIGYLYHFHFHKKNNIGLLYILNRFAVGYV